MITVQPDFFGVTASAGVARPDVDALGFLARFAQLRKGQSFSAEQVTISAAEQGIVFEDARSWGNVFVQAARDGYIRRSDVLFARSFGNGSLAPGWVGV